MQLRGKLFIVGIGPGLIDDMTVRAIDAIKRSDYVVGVDTYISQIVSLLTNQTVIRSSMGGEVERATRAVSLATERYTVSIISGGDPNVYGMASLVFELIASSGCDFDIEVIPGVTAVNAVGAGTWSSHIGRLCRRKFKRSFDAVVRDRTATGECRSFWIYNRVIQPTEQEPPLSVLSVC